MSVGILNGQVIRLVSGGHGLIHHEQGTVLVNDVLPGEQIRFRIRERGRGILWADPIEIEQAHPLRVTPPCPLFGICGGCAWQHAPVTLQREQKLEILRDAFVHQLRTDPPKIPIHPSPAVGYRVRARMKPDADSRLGFVRRRSHEIVAISHCLLFCPAINAFLTDWNADPPILKKLLQMDLLYSPGQDSLGIQLDQAPEPKELKYLTGRFPDLRIGYPGHETIMTVTAPDLPLAYHASPAAFFQVNHFLWPVMLDTLSRHLPEQFSALDLYSGVGFLIPPLMRGKHPPMAAESHSLSVRLAQKTFPQLTILRSDANHLDIPHHIDLIVCDPPRSGLSEKTRRLINSSSVQTLMYISCNQATLLRDIQDLQLSGWRLSALEVFDLFPHTPHLELFAHLNRNQ